MKFPDSPPPPSQGKYLRLGPGESVIGVFRGEPEIYYRCFENGKYRIVPSTDSEGRFCFDINLIVQEGGQLSAKIFSGNWHDFKALKELHQEFDLENTYIKITQTGEKAQKRISFSPIVKSTPDQEKLSKVELKETKRSIDGDSGFDSSDVPF